MQAERGTAEDYDDYRAIFLGRELIYQSRIFEEHYYSECDLKELFVRIEAALKKCVEDLENGTYNSNVKKICRQDREQVLYKEKIIGSYFRIERNPI